MSGLSYENLADANISVCILTMHNGAMEIAPSTVTQRRRWKDIPLKTYHLGASLATELDLLPYSIESELLPSLDTVTQTVHVLAEVVCTVQSQSTRLPIPF